MRIWPDATTGDWSIGLGHAIVRVMGDGEFRIQASALPVTAETVETISESVSVTVLVPPSTLIPIEIEAPRDAITVASVFALSGRTTGYPGALYSHASSLFDVTSGSNGSCSPTKWCHAGAGWDGPTGLGTPNGTGAF